MLNAVFPQNDPQNAPVDFFCDCGWNKTLECGCERPACRRCDIKCTECGQPYCERCMDTVTIGKDALPYCEECCPEELLPWV